MVGWMDSELKATEGKLKLNRKIVSYCVGLFVSGLEGKVGGFQNQTRQCGIPGCEFHP